MKENFDSSDIKNSNSIVELLEMILDADLKSKFPHSIFTEEQQDKIFEELEKLKK